jgi:uncharacterized protein
MQSLIQRHPAGVALALVPLWILCYGVLQPAADVMVSILTLAAGTALFEAVRFFVFETPKVLLLLTAVVFGVGIVRTYFSPESTRRILGGHSALTGNILASLLGIVTPFCSCSAVPLFIGFVSTGIPLGVTFSFLVAAPMINEVAVVLLFGLFGWKVALLYVSTGLLIAVVSGFVIGRLHVERFVEDWVLQTPSAAERPTEERPGFSDRILAGYAAVGDIVGRVWPFILIGIAVGAGIHGYVPGDFMASIMGRSVWWAVPVAVLVGVPLYSNAAGIIPIVQALLAKGASLGSTLAFMMAVIGLSLPETIILRKVLKLPLILIFIGVVTAGIISVGYLFTIVN